MFVCAFGAKACADMRLSLRSRQDDAPDAAGMAQCADYAVETDIGTLRFCHDAFNAIPIRGTSDISMHLPDNVGPHFQRLAGNAYDQRTNARFLASLHWVSKHTGCDGSHYAG